ncbi:MAG: hypothetical protein AAF202_13165, partial [Pseudomonadota bacterium]
FLAGLNALNDNRRFSSEVNELLDDLANDIQSAVAAQLPQCGNIIQRVPALFYSNHSVNQDGQSPEERIAGAEGKSIFPNLTNGVAIGDDVVYPSQPLAPFQNFVQQELSSTSPSFINTSKAHMAGGNIHCLTNVVRYCRPRPSQGGDN